MSPESFRNGAGAVACVVTGNYTPHARMLHSYVTASNPGTRFVALVLGERERLECKLAPGPEWIFWEELFSEQERLHYASLYTPFELSCVARGRLHEFLWREHKSSMWVVLDTDMIVLSSLQQLWDTLEKHTGILTPHSYTLNSSIERELNSLKAGIYNAGFLAFRRCNEALDAILWLKNRIEEFGYASEQRRMKGLTDPYGFLFVDQIWLNLLPVYFPGIHARGLPEWNLGHWNLCDGTLAKDPASNRFMFNGNTVVIAHLSGVPKANPEHVSVHAPWYRESPIAEWAELASDYLEKLSQATNESREIGYCYRELAPAYSQNVKKMDDTKNTPSPPPNTGHQGSFAKRVFRKLGRSLRSPTQLYGGLKLLSWKSQETCKAAIASLLRSEDLIFRDQSENDFTGLTPCLGNYETYLVRSWILQAVKQATPRFHGKLLDVGAGSSPYEKIIMDSSNVSQYIKMDFGKSEYHKGHSLDLAWNGVTIPLDDESVETVMMTEVLEHVHKPGNLLKEIRRVLKPEGILFLTAPFIWPLHELPHDFHRFTPIALEAYLKEAGFDIDNIQMAGGWDMSLAHLLGLWLTNRNMRLWKRRVAQLLAWPLYMFLIRRGRHECITTRNHQMFSSLSALATKPPSIR